MAEPKTKRDSSESSDESRTGDKLLDLRQKHIDELNENFRQVSRLYIGWYTF